MIKEALQEQQLAKEIDPFSLIIALAPAQLYAWIGDFDAAGEKFREAERIGEGESLLFRLFHLEYLFKKNDLKRALVEFEQIEEFLKNDPGVLVPPNFPHITYTYYYVAKGERGKAMLEIAKIEAQPESNFRTRLLATYFAMMGEKDRAFKYLDKLLANYEIQFRVLVLDPDFAQIRGDARFDALVEKTDLRIVKRSV